MTNYYERSSERFTRPWLRAHDVFQGGQEHPFEYIVQVPPEGEGWPVHDEGQSPIEHRPHSMWLTAVAAAEEKFGTSRSPYHEAVLAERRKRANESVKVKNCSVEQTVYVASVTDIQTGRPCLATQTEVLESRRLG